MGSSVPSEQPRQNQSSGSENGQAENSPISTNSDIADCDDRVGVGGVPTTVGGVDIDGDDEDDDPDEMLVCTTDNLVSIGKLQLYHSHFQPKSSSRL